MRKYIRAAVDTSYFILTDNEAYDVVFGLYNVCYSHHCDVSEFITEYKFPEDTYYGDSHGYDEEDITYLTTTCGLYINDSGEFYIPAGTSFSVGVGVLFLGDGQLDWTHFDNIPIEVNYTDLGVKCYFAHTDSNKEYSEIADTVLDLLDYCEIK